VEELDRLESRRPPPTPLRTRLILAAAGVTAALVAVSWSWHPGRHASASLPPGPASNTVAGARPPVQPSSPRTPARAEAGSVFVQPLPDCLRTDRRRSIRIAVAIENLADHPLQLVSVEVIGRIPGLTLTAQTVGGRPCADQARHNGSPIRPSEERVVALEFAVGPTCPPPVPVTARLGFLVGARLLHAETSNLVDLSSLPRLRCR
jgi:hypothetical protein